MQNFEIISNRIKEDFLKYKKDHPELLQNKIKFSWSNWGFGTERLKDSAKRLSIAGVEYIELHGNHYTPSLGYEAKETKKILHEYNLKVSGICGMFSKDINLASNIAFHRQMAVDYIRRELEFASEVGATYMLIVPAAVGMPIPCDAGEFQRSVETLRIVAGEFEKQGIRGAVEPIRSAEVSIIHTIEEAKEYINAVGAKNIDCINGDVYHMQSEETHVAKAILSAGDQLINLHLADSNRRALGEGVMDLDTIIMALYLIGYNKKSCFVTAEPLGPGADPYPAMFGKPNPQALDQLVQTSFSYFKQRENAVLSLA